MKAIKTMRKWLLISTVGNLLAAGAIAGAVVFLSVGETIEKMAASPHFLLGVFVFGGGMILGVAGLIMTCAHYVAFLRTS